MRTLHRATGVALVLAAVALSACQRDKVNPMAGGGGLAGNWNPDTGGYTAQFDNGRFTTVASDTGNVISEGGYLAISEKQVDLSWTSNVTGTQNTANCARPDLNTLNCTDGGGKSFVLRRAS
ncbi:MAG TPA: hypothetical protein VLQ68_12730 [Rhizobiaceae bacterium]|nr:hypothetical protein [Rhizobiaceae bacterium]